MPDFGAIGLGGSADKPAAPKATGDSPRRLAAEGVMQALKANDVEAFEDALATFIDAGSASAEPDMDD